MSFLHLDRDDDVDRLIDDDDDDDDGDVDGVDD